MVIVVVNMRQPHCSRLFAAFLVFLTVIAIFHLVVIEIVANYFDWSDFSSVLDRRNVLQMRANYCIKTTGCEILDYDPFDDRVRNYLEDLDPFVCPCVEGTGLTYVENSVLKINTDLLVRSHFIQRDEINQTKYNCCMWNMFRHELEDYDNFTRYSSECISFQNMIPVSDEYLKVECYLKDRRIHETFHVNHIRKPEVESRCKNATISPKCQSDERFSVIILFLDSVSSLNFRRYLPESRRVLLDDLDAIELKGYNRVGDNTFPNFISLIAGMTSDQLRSTCWPNEQSYFDNCSFIWQEFATAGYRTAFVEDFPDIGVFHFEKSGFQKQPTDYYAHNFIKEAHKLMHLQGNCLNGHSEDEIVFLWAYNFMKQFRNDPVFGIFSICRFTHDIIGEQRHVDPILSKYLQKMRDEQLNRKSFIIVMADHGMRFGEYRKSTLGKYEVNLPIFYLVPPTNFSKSHPNAHRHLRENGHRLTTPYDVYETLSDVIKCDYGGEPKIGPRASDNQRQPFSLFRPIPSKRTCATAGIPLSYCSCETSKMDIDVNSDIGRRLSGVLIEGVNNLTESHRNICAKFEALAVLKVQRVDSGNVPQLGYHYEVMINASPGNATFEGVVTEKEDNFTTGGHSTVWDPDITRIDYYGNSSNCVPNAILRKYCYCVS